MVKRKANRTACSNRLILIKKERIEKMSKIAIVYWSGTGNTEAMANAVLEGAKDSGAEVLLFTAAEFSADQMDEFDAIAFGCPSMGAEQLEDSEFEPMFNACESKLNGKKIALFGSYGWGDGEWMRNWAQTCENDGAVMACDFVICNDSPDDEALDSCIALGKALA
jgi:flavodoxin short chain